MRLKQWIFIIFSDEQNCYKPTPRSFAFIDLNENPDSDISYQVGMHHTKNIVTVVM